MSHAKLSPSGAVRWSSCTRSIPLVDELIADGVIPKEEEPSKFAEEGTQLHALIATIMGKAGNLLRQMDWWEVEKPINIPLCTTEPQIKSRYTHGTADLVGFSNWNATAYVLDWKFGRGIPVSAEYNPQLALYAWGWYHTLYALEEEVARVTMAICQPRISNTEFHFTQWVLDIQELENYLAPIFKAAEAIEKGDVEYNRSNAACRFCRAKPHCPLHSGPKPDNTKLLQEIEDNYV